MFSRCDSQLADRTVATLKIADLEALARGDILACRIPDFCDPDACAVIQRRARALSTTRYSVAPDVAKIGMALFEATDERLLEEYYQSASEAEARERALYDGLNNPIETLRGILQRLWPAGCKMERLHQEPMYAGLVRILDAGSELRPHQDNTNWDMPTSTAAQTMQTQFSCNIYFSVGEVGGELELWPSRIEDEASYRSMQVTGDYSLRPSTIGRPSLSIRPKVGDLIIFDARKVHAVSRVVRGSRINASTFIGLRSRSVPLTLFS